MAKKAKSSLGITFWVVLVVFVVLLYIVMSGKISFQGFSDAMGNSGISKAVQGVFGGDYRSASEEEKKSSQAQSSSSPETVQKKPANTEVPRVPPPPRQTQPPAVSGNTPPPRTAPAQTSQPKQAPSEPVSKSAQTAPPKEPTKTRNAVLYFVRLSENGDVTLTKTLREVPSGNTPLTDALQALTSGPTEKEKQAGYTSLIPSESKLLSVAVKDGIAFANFNENFRFNSFGREGYDGQIKQTIYTITEFPNIQAVQILINGKQVDYLGTEGIFIGKPVRRDSL